MDSHEQSQAGRPHCQFVSWLAGSHQHLKTKFQYEKSEHIWFLVVQFSSVTQSCPTLYETPCTATRQASLSITNSRSPPKPMSIKSVMPSNHLILCRPLLLLPSIFPSIRVFSNESALRIRWPKYWSSSFNISPSSEHPGLIIFRIDCLNLLEVQGPLKRLLQHHSSKASVILSLGFTPHKSRDITLPAKISLVKAMVFPVVMYGCESWTIKKAERRRIDAFERWCWRRLLRVL